MTINNLNYIQSVLDKQFSSHFFLTGHSKTYIYPTQMLDGAKQVINLIKQRVSVKNNSFHAVHT